MASAIATNTPFVGVCSLREYVAQGVRPHIIASTVMSN